MEVSFHEKWFSVHPVVLSMVAALGLNCGSDNVQFHNLESKSRHYLKRMGLFDLLKIDSGMEIVEHEPAGRFIPLTKIADTSSLGTFIENMIPLLHLEPEKAKPIRYIISELIRNVFEHSGSAIGAVLCAQYYKKSNSIRLGIVDGGVGIRKTINAAYPVGDDLNAIKLALTPGITGTTRQIGGSEQNAGAGLFFIKSIAKVNRDFFMIYSGNSMYKLLKTAVDKKVRLYADPFQDKHSNKNNLPYWQGTVVGVDLNLNSNEAFNHLLNLIREIYSKTIKERRKQYYKRRPRFI